MKNPTSSRQAPARMAAQKITVDSAFPAIAEQGTTLDVTIKGSGFRRGAASPTPGAA